MSSTLVEILETADAHALVAQLVQRPQDGSAALEGGDDVEPDSSVGLVDDRGRELTAEPPVQDRDHVVAPTRDPPAMSGTGTACPP